VCIAIGLLATVSALAGGSFLDSDTYRKGEEVVGVLLTDDDYGKMLEDVVHLGKLDWAWVLGQEDSPKVKSQGFLVDDYSSVVVRRPTDPAGKASDWISERAHEVSSTRRSLGASI